MDIHYQLMRTHTALSRRITSRAQKELGLSSGQPKVLDCLLSCEGCDQKTLATKCEIEQATLGSILLRMEEKGLIERKQENGNRRSLFVYLTDEGRSAAVKMQRIFKEEDENALQKFNKEEQEDLSGLLRKIWEATTGNMEDGNE